MSCGYYLLARAYAHGKSGQRTEIYLHLRSGGRPIYNGPGSQTRIDKVPRSF